MTSTWIDSATQAFEDSLSTLVGSAQPHVDPLALGRQAALQAIAGQLWSEHLGPLYDTEGVQALLGGVSKQAVSDRVRRHRLIALRTGSGRMVYPAFQFERQAVITGLGEVLSLIAPNDEEMWLAASWFVTPDPALGDISPIDAIRARLQTLVLDAARDVAASLRG